MQRHDRYRLALGLIGIHHQRDVLEEAGEALELVHGAHQLLEVLQPAGGVGRAVLLPHLGVAALVEHDLGQLGVRQRLVLALAPAVEGADQVAQRAARLGLELVGLDHRARGLGERDAALAGVVVQQLHGGVAETALRAR